MINISEVIETNKMVLEENLDVRTITVGISLLDCSRSSLKETCDCIYSKIVRIAKDLVKTGDDSSLEVRALLWSVKKTPGEKRDTYVVELLPLL